MLTAPVNVSVYGGMGEIITFKTLPVIIMGGLGNVRGTFFAAMILGIAESLVATYVGLQFRDTVGFATLMLADVAAPRAFLRASPVLTCVRGQTMSTQQRDLSLPAPPTTRSAVAVRRRAGGSGAASPRCSSAPTPCTRSSSR